MGGPFPPSRAARSRFYLKTREGSYNDQSLIEFIRQLRRHFPGEQVILIWDRLPSHRSRLMQLPS